MAGGPQVAKVGNLTKDPVLRETTTGKKTIKFTIVVNPYAPVGQPKLEPQFYDVQAWNSLAENAATSFRKGHRIVVFGEGKTEEWSGKDGVSHTSKVIVAEAFGHDIRFVVSSIEKAAPGAAQMIEAAFAGGEDEEPF